MNTQGPASKKWRRASGWLAGAVVLSSAVLLASGQDINPLEGAIEVRVLRTVTPKNMTMVAPLPGRGITGGGLAVDDAGNMYMSDVGLAERGGSIIMLPKDGRTGFRLVRGLNHPTDVELTPDQHALMIAGTSGTVFRVYLGVSVKVAFKNPPRDPTVFLKTDTATYSAKPALDGYYNFLNVLNTEQKSQTVDVSVQDQLVTFPFPKRMLQTSGGQIVGHTVIDVTVNNE